MNTISKAKPGRFARVTLGASFLVLLIALVVPPGTQSDPWITIVNLLLLLPGALLVYCLLTCLRRQWRKALSGIMYLTASVFFSVISTIVIDTKIDMADMNSQAIAYANVRIGMDKEEVAVLFKDLLEGLSRVIENQEQEIDDVETYEGVFHEIINVYFKDGKVVGKCLNFRSDPRPQFPPINPALPKRGEPCY